MSDKGFQKGELTSRFDDVRAAAVIYNNDPTMGADESANANSWAMDQGPDHQERLEATAFNHGMKDDGAGSIGRIALSAERTRTSGGENTAEAREKKREQDAAHLRRSQELTDWQNRMNELIKKIATDLDAFDEKQQEAEENERAIREGLDILKHGSTADKRLWLSDHEKGAIAPSIVAGMSDEEIDKAFPDEIRKKIDLHKEFMNEMKTDLDKIQQEIDKIRAEYKAKGHSPEQIDETVSKYVDRLDKSGKGLTAMQERANGFGIELAEFNEIKNDIRKNSDRDYDILGRGEDKQDALKFQNSATEQTVSENPFTANVQHHKENLSAATVYTENPFSARAGSISGAFNASAEGNAPPTVPNAPEVEPVQIRNAPIPNPFG